MLQGGEGGDDLLALLVGERAAVGAVEAELGDVAAHQLVQLAGGEGGDDLLALLVEERAAVGAVEAELGDVAAHQPVQLAGGEGGDDLLALLVGERRGWGKSCCRSSRGGARLYWELMKGGRNLFSCFTSHFSCRSSRLTTTALGRLLTW